MQETLLPVEKLFTDLLKVQQKEEIVWVQKKLLLIKQLSVDPGP